MATGNIPDNNGFRWTDIATGTSLNDIKTPGVYRVWGAYNDTWTTSNIYGSLEVLGNYLSNGSVIQIYYAATSSAVYYRGYTNSQWYPWKKIMRENDSLSFQTGDSYPGSSNSVFYAHGWVTSAQKEVTCDIVLPKRCPSGLTPTLSYSSMVARGISGYLNGNNAFTPDSVAVNRRSDYVLEMRCYCDEAITNVANNTPVGIYINGRIVFS